MRDKIAIIIGAGPAGLSAAYNFLTKTEDILPVVLEELDCVGGISRTVHYNGNGIDLGGHRLFSKNQEILDFWEEILPLQGKPPIDDKILGRKITVSENGPDPDETDRVMLKRKRVSRIYYLRKFFDYPISLKASTILNMDTQISVPEHVLKNFLTAVFIERSSVFSSQKFTIRSASARI